MYKGNHSIIPPLGNQQMKNKRDDSILISRRAYGQAQVKTNQALLDMGNAGTSLLFKGPSELLNTTSDILGDRDGATIPD